MSDTESETVLAGERPVLAAPVPVPMDEEATEVAGAPPPIPQQEIVVRAVERESPTRPVIREAKPRARIGMMGTKAAGALAAQAKVRKREQEIADVKVPELRLLQPHLTRPQLERLDAIFGGRAERRGDQASASPKRALERLTHTSAYRELDPPHRARLLAAVAESERPVESSVAARELCEARPFSALGPKDRPELLGAFLALPGPRQRDLATLARRSLRGKTALADRDIGDVALVAHLHRMATEPRLGRGLEAAGVRPNEVLGAVLTALARPASLPIESGGDGVLGVLEFALADGSPAELLRLWRLLTGPDLHAALPGDGALDLGAALTAQPGLAFTGNNTPLRVGLEQLVGLAHPRSGPRRAGFIMHGSECLDADVIARALGYLYGVGFTVAAGRDNALRYLRADHAPERVPPIFVSVLHDGGERLFVFDRLDEQRVYLRGPHGASPKPIGAKRPEPERRVEDPARGIDSLDRAAFEAHVGVALVPRT